MKKYIAEFIGTFALVFFGTGAIIVNDVTNNSFGLIGIALTFGFMVTAVIYTFGTISGAHINPSVTIAFTINKKINLIDALFYIVFQLIGAITASYILKKLFQTHPTLGMTLPMGSETQSFIMEFVSTFFLMLVILGITQKDSTQTKSLSGIIIGITILAMIFVAGPISGGSFNPARSIGPAIIIGIKHSHLWLYILAPTLGAVLSVYIWKWLSS